jgi:hypothetical protein
MKIVTEEIGDNLTISLNKTTLSFNKSNDANMLLNFYLFIIITCFNHTNFFLDEAHIKDFARFERFENIAISPIKFDLLELYGIVFMIKAYKDDRIVKSQIIKKIPKFDDKAHKYNDSDWNCNFLGKTANSNFCNQIKIDYDRRISNSKRECNLHTPPIHSLCNDNDELITLEKLYNLVIEGSIEETNLRHFIFSSHQSMFSEATFNIPMPIFTPRNTTKYIKDTKDNYIFSLIQ